MSFVVRKHSSAIRERRKMEGKKRREKNIPRLYDLRA
jgi:hypothetical protein